MTNWKTSSIGLVGAIAIGTVHIFQGGDVTDTGTWINMIISALAGLFAKDFNVTGGTVQQ